MHDYAREIVTIGETNPNDFLGFCLCHDARLRMAIGAIGSAIEALRATDLPAMALTARVICRYLDKVDAAISLTMLKSEPADAATEDEWNMRIESIMAVGELKMEIRERWGTRVPIGENRLISPVRLNKLRS